MPLDAKNKTSSGVFDCFDHAVVSKRHGPQIPADSLDRLMMIAIHVDLVLTRKPSDNAVGGHSNQVPDRRLIVLIVVRRWIRH